VTAHQELFELAKELKHAAAAGDEDIVQQPLTALETAARSVGKSFSGSWAGYHSRVYYADLATPPPGAHFSQEWGLKDMSGTSLGSAGDWREYDAEQIKQHVRRLANDPDLSPARSLAKTADETFEKCRSEIVSILHGELADHQDSFLAALKTQVEALEVMSPMEVAQHLSPKGAMMTRDTIVIGQGTQVPPHISESTQVSSIRHSFQNCLAAADIATKSASHIERRRKKRISGERVGTNVFIGHGRSFVWRDLKDFIQDRVGLPWDEFNRVPVAGVTNIARLSEMLDAAAVAFVVMTAEDEMADGALHARMNVIHEVGLFQGRLGFTKAIILLEEGCEEFTNIQGLGQIRFPKGRISAVFEDIRQVLEREGLVDAS